MLDAERTHFSGVTVQCRDHRSRLVGDPYPRDPMDVTPLEMVYRYKVRGEKWGFQRTDLLGMYPFDPSDEEGTAGAGRLHL